MKRTNKEMLRQTICTTQKKLRNTHFLFLTSQSAMTIVTGKNQVFSHFFLVGNVGKHFFHLFPVLISFNTYIYIYIFQVHVFPITEQPLTPNTSHTVQEITFINHKCKIIKCSTQKLPVEINDITIWRKKHTPGIL